MKYSDIQTLVYQLTNTNASSMSGSVLNSYTQPAEDQVAAIIMQADSRWQYDDLNQSDLPITTFQLNAGQQDYSLSYAQLTVDRVEVLDTSGIWHLLTPIDEHDIRFEALPEHLKTQGLPLEYDKLGNSVFFYPIPNYTLANAARVYFTRGPLKFDYSLNTFTDASGSLSSSPGFASIFHDLIAYLAAEPYAIANMKDNLEAIQNKIASRTAQIQAFYGQRSHDERPRMGVSTNGGSGNQSGVLSNSASDSNR